LWLKTAKIVKLVLWRKTLFFDDFTHGKVEYLITLPGGNVAAIKVDRKRQYLTSPQTTPVFLFSLSNQAELFPSSGKRLYHGLDELNGKVHEQSHNQYTEWGF
jgi:hypothetical protein